MSRIIVPTHWQQLVVHCGVSHLAEGLVLESTANTAGYSACDVNGCLPSLCDGEKGTECQRLRTDLDLERVALETRLASKNHTTVPVSVSEDAGRWVSLSPLSQEQIANHVHSQSLHHRYLCEYIYYKSLSINSNRCVFIHVPQLEKHSKEESAQTLTCIIQSLLRQM